METIYKTFKAEVKGVNADEGTLDILIPVSTASVDRDGEVVEPLAFKKTLPKFMKRPVLVASHDYRDLTSQIGEWTKLKITDSGVEGKPKYYINEGNEQADWGFKLASKGMAAFSIGFIPKVWADGDGMKEPRRTYTEVELLEISQVIVPSNREAIQSIRSKSVDPIVNEICDEVEKELEPEGKELITKPEVTDEYVRIPVKECKITATIDISKDEGIKALYCGKEKEIATYLFLKEKGWTMAKARAWVKDHAKKYLIAETTTENEDINITVVKIPDNSQIYKRGEEEKTSQEQIIDEIDYLKTLIGKEGLNDKAQEAVRDLIKSMHLPGDDIPVKIGDDLSVSNGDDLSQPSNTTITFNEIQESLKRISNIGGICDPKGDEGSGNFGHEGRPGEVGGSGEGGGGISSNDEIKWEGSEAQVKWAKSIRTELLPV